MKRIFAGMLAALLLLSPMAALAANTISFTFHCQSGVGTIIYRMDFDDERTVYDLRAFISTMPGAEYWSAPGPDDAELRKYYSGSVSIYLFPGGVEGYAVPIVPAPVGSPAPGFSVPEHGAGSYAVDTPPASNGKGGTVSANANASRSTSSASSKDLTWSKEYLYQVQINGKGMDFRLFGDGEKIAFKEKISAEKGGQRLTLTTYSAFDELVPALSQDALDALEGYGIKEVVISRKDATETYTLEELKAFVQ